MNKRRDMLIGLRWAAGEKSVRIEKLVDFRGYFDQNCL